MKKSIKQTTPLGVAFKETPAPVYDGEDLEACDFRHAADLRLQGVGLKEIGDNIGRNANAVRVILEHRIPTNYCEPDEDGRPKRTPILTRMRGVESRLDRDREPTIHDRSYLVLLLEGGRTFEECQQVLHLKPETLRRLINAVKPDRGPGFGIHKGG